MLYSSLEGRLKIPFFSLSFWKVTSSPFLSNGQIAANLNYENESLIFVLMPYDVSAGASGDELEFGIKFD